MGASAAEMKNITIELLRRGYSKADITKIWGGNIMRVFRKVEEVAGINPTSKTLESDWEQSFSSLYS